MTAERLASGARAPEPQGPTPDQGLPATDILAMCDRLLGEVGRRRHMFAWLRAPGSGTREWLPVDAYYPQARLVVMCRPGPDPHVGLYRELVPAHGLGLLRLDPAALGHDKTAVETALAGRIFDLEHVPRPAPRDAAQAPGDAPAPPWSPVNPAPLWSPVKVERTAVVPAVEQGVGLIFGIGLAAILIAELYLGVAGVALGAGRAVLGFAIALDACSRALGTVAAARAGERGWACACAIGGAPFVIWFAFWRSSGRAEVEPAPLAGLLACVAVAVAAIALLLDL